jgi:hypothetical protein
MFHENGYIPVCMVKLIIIEAFLTQNILFQKVPDRAFDHVYREITDIAGDHWL